MDLMNWWQKYIAYLKDNSEGYWFKRKIFGWGWTPAKWQGWITLIVFLGILVWLGIDFGSNPEPTSDQLFWFFAKLVALTLVVIGVCYWKGQPPRWQWGIPDDERIGDSDSTTH